MYNMNKEAMETFLRTSNKKHFCTIIIERRTPSGEFFDQSILDESKEACEKLLQASYVTHHIEIMFNRIVCFLNYDKNYFSIRAFVGSLRQVLFTISMNTHSYVFYSDAFSSMDEIFTELTFLFDHTNYGILLGKQQPIPAAFLHSCVTASSGLDRSSFYFAFSELQKQGYHQFSDFLTSESQMFSHLLGSDTYYTFQEMQDYISEIYYALRLFFREKNYSHTLFDQPLYDLLIQNSGITGLLRLLSQAVSEYASLFETVTASDKTKQLHQEILTFIEQNISTVSLSTLSSYFALTPAYICRIFKQEQHLNFTDYVKKKRFDLATETLQNNLNITISELSKQLGYKSQSYFQNSFKEEFGISPDAYRKQFHKRKQI